MEYLTPKNTTVVQGIPIGRLNNLEHRVSALENGGSSSSAQEKSTTTPDGSTSTFAFTHTPALIFWNGALQTLTDDYTVSSNTVTFTGSAGIPLTGDKIINIY